MKLPNTLEILLLLIFLCYNVKAEISYPVEFELADPEKTVKSGGIISLLPA
jgi:hypothetical protein